jgi:hypothetical protein
VATGHFDMRGASPLIGKVSRAKLRSAGVIDDGSPTSAAQPRFHQINWQSAAKTATATSPNSVEYAMDARRDVIRDLPVGWRGNFGQPIQMISFRVREMQGASEYGDYLRRRGGGPSLLQT